MCGASGNEGQNHIIHTFHSFSMQRYTRNSIQSLLCLTLALFVVVHLPKSFGIFPSNISCNINLLLFFFSLFLTFFVSVFYFQYFFQYFPSSLFSINYSLSVICFTNYFLLQRKSKQRNPRQMRYMLHLPLQEQRQMCSITRAPIRMQMCSRLPWKELRVYD